jgi:hypothetical protein
VGQHAAAAAAGFQLNFTAGLCKCSCSYDVLAISWYILKALQLQQDNAEKETHSSIATSLHSCHSYTALATNLCRGRLSLHLSDILFKAVVRSEENIF